MSMNTPYFAQGMDIDHLKPPEGCRPGIDCQRWIIRGARVIDPAGGLDTVTDVFIDKAGIVGVGQAPADFATENVLDATGLWLIPGVIVIPGSGRPSSGRETGSASSLMAMIFSLSTRFGSTAEREASCGYFFTAPSIEWREAKRKPSNCASKRRMSGWRKAALSMSAWIQTYLRRAAA